MLLLLLLRPVQISHSALREKVRDNDYVIVVIHNTSKYALRVIISNLSRPLDCVDPITD
jgi:hypothetical protein